MNRALTIFILGVLIVFAGCINFDNPLDEQKSTPNMQTNNPANNTINASNETVLPGVNGTNVTDTLPFKNETTEIQPETSDCIDSDGGKILNLSGSVIYEGREYKDRCEAGNLYEYYCQNGKMEGSVISCSSTTHCINGSCVFWAPTCTEYAEEKYIKLDNHTGHSQTFANFCDSSNSLLKYYCSGSHVMNMTVACSDTQYCSSADKACKTITCRDHFNFITYGNSVYPDKCYSGTQIKYYDCNEDGRIQTNIQDCGDGYFCALTYEPDGDVYVGYCTAGPTLPNLFDYYATIRLERDTGALLEEVKFRPNDVAVIMANKYKVEINWITATRAEILFDGQSYVLGVGNNVTVGDNEDVVLIFKSATTS
ncbi:MAG: hypothetical protein WCT31_01335 [Candidatus Micrarchaeia archaeon]|jgi:hypothetical protein